MAESGADAWSCRRKDKKPAPRRTINGMWSALRLGNQSGACN